MNHLELFSGTGSFGKVSKKIGYDIVSLDTDGRATITEDILKWDYKTYPQDYFRLITASPPCDDYSIMNNCRPEKKNKDLSHADDVVKKTLEIIEYFNPEIWVLENPQTGKLKNRPFMEGLKYNDCDYCKYGFGIRKRTRFWNNIPDLSLKSCKKDCEIIKDGKHPSFRYLNKVGMNRMDLRHTIPEKLIEEIIKK